ncbi:hypothetical protein EON67_10835 [archaeon]|nr:MAG: hypothetical protein EON67_10835 [archaeon]
MFERARARGCEKLMASRVEIDEAGFPRVAMTLGDLNLSCTPLGVWSVSSATLHEHATKADVAAAEAQLRALRDAQARLGEQMVSALEERDSAERKAERLMDMLVAAELQNQRLQDDLVEQETMATALKWYVVVVRITNGGVTRPACECTHHSWTARANHVRVSVDLAGSWRSNS